jgi:membrane protein YfhO
VRGYEALTFLRYQWTYRLWCVEQPIWFNRVDDLTKPFLSFLNVRYAITGMGETPAGWHVVAEGNASRILENEHVLPRAFVPPRTTVGRDGPVDPTLPEMQETNDFGERAWIDAPMPRHEESNGPGVVTSIEKMPNGLRIGVNMAKAGRVVVSETAWKGWRAYIDGRRVQMQTANLAFLAIYVPAGPHGIRLIYLPDSFVIGRAITVATLIALIAFAVFKKKRPSQDVRQN